MLHEWLVSIGDFTFWGWLITAAYGVSIIVAIYFIKLVTQTGNKELRLLWIFITCVLLVLGVNKQLDLQILLRNLGRALAEIQGWQEYRRIVQKVFSIIFVLGICIFTSIVFMRARRILLKAWIEIIGMIILFAFAMIRTGSINHIVKAESIEKRALHIHAIELLGLFIILLALFCHFKRLKGRS